MSAKRGAAQASIRDLIKLGTPIAERISLEAKPATGSVESYVLTRGAQRALEAITRQQSSPAGAAFWIGGPAGAGKTHFLNYLVALDQRAGVASLEDGRKLALGCEVSAARSSIEIEAQLLESLTAEVAGDQHSSILWRQMRGREAFLVILDQAYRSGVRALTIALDLGANDPQIAAGCLETLAEVCAVARRPPLIALAAGLEGPPMELVSFDVAPADEIEEAEVAISRARRLEADAAVGQWYRGVDCGPYEPEAIFPFHPAALRVLRLLRRPAGGVADLARLAREALAPGDQSVAVARGRELLMPADLMVSREIARRVEQRIGEAGRHAERIARGVAREHAGGERELAERVIDSLVLASLSRGACTVAELAALLESASGASASRRETELARIVLELAANSHGAIRFDGATAAFEPLAAGGADVAAFNNALEVMRLFDPALTRANEVAEVRAKLKRLGDAIARALESEHQTRATLERLFPWVARRGIRGDDWRGPRDAPAIIAAEIAETLDAFGALCGEGPSAILEADAIARLKIAQTVAAYQRLENAAAIAPRISTMLNYLHASAIACTGGDSPSHDKAVVTLETEQRLLMVELRPEAVFAGPQAIGALEARFQKFKWGYAQRYRIAHERWREEMKPVLQRQRDLERLLKVLGRLDRIGALGSPAAPEFQTLTADLAARVRQCDLETPVAPEVMPRCERCGFSLGDISPGDEIEELLRQVQRALRTKLEALSSGAIARLVREHDGANRLDGFLRIIQAANVQALVGVLDDNLTSYLAGLIEENRSALEAGAVSQPLLIAHEQGASERPTRARRNRELPRK